MKKKLLLGFAAMLLSWTAWAALVDNDPTSPFFIEGIDDTGVITYAGDDTNPKITVKYGEDAETATVLGETNYSLTYTFKGVGDEKETSVDGVRNVGHYTLTVEGKGLPYSFSPKKTIEFDVEPKQITERLVLENAEKDYGQDDQDILVNLVTGFNGKNKEDVLAAAEKTDEEFADFLACLEVGRNGTSTGETVGSYQVIVNGKVDTEDSQIKSNYRYTATDKGDYATLTINPKGLVVKIDYDREYRGKDKAVSMESLATGKVNDKLLWYFDGDLEAYTDLPTISTFAAYKDDAGNEIADKDVAQAGTYYLKAELAGNEYGNYTIANDGEIELVIKQATLAITLKDDVTEKWNEATYGDANIPTVFTNNFNFTTFVNNETEEDDDIKLTMQRAAGTDVVENGYAIMPYVNGNVVTLTDGENTTALRNYKIVYAKNDQQAFTINAKDINNLTGIDLAINDLQYQGQAFDLAEGGLKVTYTAGTATKNLTETEYEVDKATPITAKNAGTQFTVKVKGTGNYTGEKEKTFTIARRTLTIEPNKVEGENVTISKEYGTKDPENLLSTYFTVDGWAKQEEDDPSINKLRMARHNSGPEDEVVKAEGYTIYLYNGESGDEGYMGEGENQTVLPNYRIAYDFGTKFYITPKELHYTITATKEYDGEADLPTTFKISSNDLVTNEAIGIDDSEKNVFTDMPEIALAEGVTAKNVGNYTLVVATEGKAANYTPVYTPAEGQTNYEITARSLTITAPDCNLAFGETLPTETDLADWVADYKKTIIENENPAKGEGPLADDRRALREIMYLTIDDEDALAGASGEYPIVINFTEDAKLTEAQKTALAEYGYEDVATLLVNYGGLEAIKENTTNGTLTIGEVTDRIVVLDGSIKKSEESDEELTEDQMTVAEKIAKYNGAKVKTVIVKGLAPRDDKSFVGEKWYTLVLPFKISVRDLSNAFGYAIVNVPDVNNTDPNLAKFKLTMGEIEPNTLIVFKVDETDQIINEITFTDRTIVEPAKDEEGNYVWYTDPANVTYKGVYEDYTTKDRENEYWIHTDGTFWNGSVTLHPLSGFISYATKPAAARLSLENPDGSTTVIDAITMEAVKSADGWYTTGGMKLSGEPTQKGVYINNGKKVVIK